MKLFKNQKGFSDVITITILAGVIGAIFIGGVFVWKEIDKVNTLNGLYSKLSKVVKVEKKVEEVVEEAEVGGLMINGEKARSCPETLSLDDKSSLAVGFYGGFRINGCEYSSDKILDNNHSISSCSENIDDELNKKNYNIVNGCVFNEGKRVFEKNLIAKINFGDFGEEYLTTRESKDRKSMGEGAIEWFRFEDKEDLYIFLKGVAGCEGCVYNDPYLLINLNTDDIQFKSANIPYLPYLFLSPDHKKAIEVEFEQINISDNRRELPTKLYVFDFVNFEKGKLLYEVPENSSILVSGGGFYPTGISWLDNSTAQVQLFKNRGDGTVFDFKDENNHINLVKQGEPVIIQVY